MNVIHKIRDDETGSVIEVEAPENASDEDLARLAYDQIYNTPAPEPEKSNTWEQMTSPDETYGGVIGDAIRWAGRNLVSDPQGLDTEADLPANIGQAVMGVGEDAVGLAKDVARLPVGGVKSAAAMVGLPGSAKYAAQTAGNYIAGDERFGEPSGIPYLGTMGENVDAVEAAVKPVLGAPSSLGKAMEFTGSMALPGAAYNTARQGINAVRGGAAAVPTIMQGATAMNAPIKHGLMAGGTAEAVNAANRAQKDITGVDLGWTEKGDVIDMDTAMAVGSLLSSFGMFKPKTAREFAKNQEQQAHVQRLIDTGFDPQLQGKTTTMGNKSPRQPTLTVGQVTGDVRQKALDNKRALSMGKDGENIRKIYKRQDQILTTGAFKKLEAGDDVVRLAPPTNRQTMMASPHERMTGRRMDAWHDEISDEFRGYYSRVSLPPDERLGMTLKALDGAWDSTAARPQNVVRFREAVEDAIRNQQVIPGGTWGNMRNELSEISRKFRGSGGETNTNRANLIDDIINLTDDYAVDATGQSLPTEIVDSFRDARRRWKMWKHIEQANFVSDKQAAPHMLTPHKLVTAVKRRAGPGDWGRESNDEMIEYAKAVDNVLGGRTSIQPKAEGVGMGVMSIGAGMGTGAATLLAGASPEVAAAGGAAGMLAATQLPKVYNALATAPGQTIRQSGIQAMTQGPAAFSNAANAANALMAAPGIAVTGRSGYNGR